MIYHKEVSSSVIKIQVSSHLLLSQKGCSRRKELEMYLVNCENKPIHRIMSDEMQTRFISKQGTATTLSIVREFQESSRNEFQAVLDGYYYQRDLISSED